MTGSQPKFRFTLIAGPTASGKSALAANVAREHGGIVVNADSMQVYKDLRLLTARPGEEEEAAVPHRLYGFRAAEEPYSVAAWLADLEPLVAQARAGGPPLVITGGTGLYFKALLEGLSPVPEIPVDIRQFWRAEAAEKGSAALYGVLQARDPAMAERLSPSDPQRIVRALEVLDASGKSLREWQATGGTSLIGEHEADRIHVCPPRETLYARCDMRLDSMVEAGVLDEVRALRQRHLDPSLPVMRALGVRSFLAYLDGVLDWEAALTDAKTETRRYAKRQMTWARRNMISWKVSSTQ
jgi:tRNA dimethylallyltransferase